MVRQSGIHKILIADVLKLTGAERGAHAIDHHDDKTEFCQRTHIAVIGNERFRHILVAGSLIDVFHHGIFLRIIEV